MCELDKMMTCLGFSETNVKNYGNAMPFTSRKLEIIGQINQVAMEKARHADLLALFYILPIAFAVLLMRCIVYVQTGDATLMTFCTSIVIRYSQALQSSLTAMSLFMSIVICVGTGVMIYHLKNENHFC